MLKMSTLLLRTLRDDPADAEVASHRLLVRAGFVRRVAAGIYSWLPLGYRTYRKIENVVREEMDKAGFQEVHFPALLPKDPYNKQIVGLSTALIYFACKIEKVMIIY